jgi:hypothetical protein
VQWDPEESWDSDAQGSSGQPSPADSHAAPPPPQQQQWVLPPPLSAQQYGYNGRSTASPAFGVQPVGSGAGYGMQPPSRLGSAAEPALLLGDYDDAHGGVPVLAPSLHASQPQQQYAAPQPQAWGDGGITQPGQQRLVQYVQVQFFAVTVLEATIWFGLGCSSSAA